MCLLQGQFALVPPRVECLAQGDDGGARLAVYIDQTSNHLVTKHHTKTTLAEDFTPYPLLLKKKNNRHNLFSLKTLAFEGKLSVPAWRVQLTPGSRV